MLFLSSIHCISPKAAAPKAAANKRLYLNILHAGFCLSTESGLNYYFSRFLPLKVGNHIRPLADADDWLCKFSGLQGWRSSLSISRNTCHIFLRLVATIRLGWFMSHSHRPNFNPSFASGGRVYLTADRVGVNIWVAVHQVIGVSIGRRLNLRNVSPGRAGRM